MGDEKAEKGQFWSEHFTPVYKNVLAIMGLLALALILFIITVPEGLHGVAFDFVVPFSMSSAAMALIFAKRSTGKDQFSLNAFGIVLYAVLVISALVVTIDLEALVKDNDPTQLFGSFGVGFIAAIITVASVFANSSKE